MSRPRSRNGRLPASAAAATPRSAASKSPAGVFATLGVAISIGLGWYLIEFVQIAIEDPSFHSVDTLSRLLRYLPWQIACFALLGLLAVPFARVIGLASSGVLWTILALATFTFLGSRIAEGMSHGSSGITILGVVLASGAAIAALAIALAVSGRLLPTAVAAAWPLAACAAWSLLFVPFFRRASPAIGLGAHRGVEWGSYVHVGEFAAALAVVVTVLVASRSRRAARLILIAGLLLALAGAVSRSSDAAVTTEGTAHRPDVIVILLDTLRADRAHLLEAEKATGGAADDWTSDFFRFARAYSPGSRTSLALPGIMTSLSAGVVGAALSPDAETLAELLQNAGYATLGISANPRISPQFGYHQGFDQLILPGQGSDFLVVSLLKLVAAAAPGASYRLGIADADLFYPRITRLRRLAIRLLARSPEPTFLYLQTMDIHGPYLPPKKYLPASYEPGEFLSYFRFIRLSETDALRSAELSPRIENLEQRYAAEIRFTGDELGHFISDLRKQGRWEEALVWILSDHGEAFGDHGGAGHGGGYLGSEVLKIPLWLKVPRSWGFSPRPIDSPVSAYDILPTTLSLLGLPALEESFGLDLTPLLLGQPADPKRLVISQSTAGRRAALRRLYACIQGNWKLHLAVGAQGTVARALYDLRNDPDENLDVALQHPDIAADLEAAVHTHRLREADLAHSAQGRAVDLRTLEQLRSLGYTTDDELTQLPTVREGASLRPE